MARPPKSGRRDTCQAIRAAAIRLFSRKGFTGTSTRELCRAARVTKPVLYHYFSTKDDLFQQLVKEALDDYRQGLLGAAEGAGTAEQRLAEVVRNDFQFTRREPELLRLLYRLVFAPEPIVEAEKLVAAGTEELSVLTRIAGQGVRSGEWRGRPGEIGLSVLGLSQIHMLAYLVTGEGRLSPAQARRCVQIALEGCVRRRGARKGAKSPRS